MSTYLIGTYTDTKTQGIELLSFDQQSMLLSSKVVANDIENPTFVIANRARALIFAVENVQNGKLNSYGFNQGQQSLKLIDKTDSLGNHPCYLALDNSEHFLAVANQTSDDIRIFQRDLVTGHLEFSLLKIKIN